ncbi:MAG: tRNA (cytidine(34)-2'-O)-methyltransferase [Abditibacteriota bacterium]|nr:tRNA (cytidine(34)-2'-O)-methyltransferase [Abditibacteriota bacterium]
MTSNLNIVLYAPEIPQNTGNIGRTCYLTMSSLHLIEPLGFRLSEKAVRRAGLDYWSRLDVRVHPSLEAFLRYADTDRIFPATTKAARPYTEACFRQGDYIVFGRESAGLPAPFLEAYRDRAVRIPMHPRTDRSLNLSNAAAVILYEALRQMDFAGLK